MKKHLGKLIGFVLGIIAAQWAGGGLGFVLGAGLDFVLQGRGRKTIKRETAPDEITDFALSAVLLASRIVRADGSVSDLEMGYIRSFLGEQFGETDANTYLAILQKAIANPDLDPNPTLDILRESCSYETLLQLLYFLYGIASADFSIEAEEIAIIRDFAKKLGLRPQDLESVQAMFTGDMASYYRILEINPSVSDAAVRAAFHEMALKYHPDKVAHLGALIQKNAQTKFMKVQEAYDAIRRERGFR